MRALVALAVTVAAAACASTTSTPPATQAAASDPSLERLYFARVTDRAIQVRVATNGCTSEESFAVDAALQAAGGYLVAIRRVAPDECRRTMPEGVMLEFPRSTIGAPADAAIAIANPVRRLGQG